MGIYFIADTHFNHRNIIKYCDRPFEDIEDMNNTLIENWNNTVSDNDTIYHLGDVALSDESKLKEIISKLNGNKILIRGNHDNKTVSFYENVGFTVLRNAPVILDKFKVILSHVPLPDTMIPKGFMNIHGHIHNNFLNEDCHHSDGIPQYPIETHNPSKHICVSVDVIDFKPIKLEDLLY